MKVPVLEGKEGKKERRTEGKQAGREGKEGRRKGEGREKEGRKEGMKARYLFGQWEVYEVDPIWCMVVCLEPLNPFGSMWRF